MATSTNFGLGTVDSSETTNTDNSKAFGGVQNATTDQLGSNVSLSEVSGSTLYLTDQGAIAAAKAIALKGLDTGASTLAAIADTSETISKRGLDLAEKAAAGEGGTLIRGLIALAGIAAVGLVGWAYFGRRKKKG